MTKSRKLTNTLKQTWQNTNSGNWDSIQHVLKSAKKMIDGGSIDQELVSTYLIISEAFTLEFGKRL